MTVLCPKRSFRYFSGTGLFFLIRIVRLGMSCGPRGVKEEVVHLMASYLLVDLFFRHLFTEQMRQAAEEINKLEKKQSSARSGHKQHHGRV